ncbi:LysM peptidoglycan-binding domain-containing protein [Kingella sp. (in: b-proteobacteria)]|uniref:LysM peptidoglycan-binding domain-containing protein n=1 Tax=Kingella sp. (in: b-proteobacteria) TaxID=2020713 RepID=UPI0026DA882A|nr:LysM peptidoglycan-binding domain-containing protein [Kingella sp. (in: b-proteobacteria)]MDO4658542.1 transglycosylase SLT domain-containing protein [Kingella sp. (in: b-proteobacteria)]
MKTIKNIALAVSSLILLPTLAHGETYKPAQTGAAMMQLQNTPFSKKPIATFLSGGSVWDSLRKNFRMQEVNSGLVRSHETKFAQNSAYFNRTIQRSTPYMYYITDEVKKRNMPAEVALLPFIESAYVTKARSHVGASGLWQFMPATGRHYGLEQTPLYDGRHDVHAATNAALNYLQYLYGLFGDWSLALAAYNWGEGNVTRAVNRAIAQGLPPTYENLKMPAETRNYVPKLLAVRNLVNNPSAFGLKLPEIKSEPYFKTVTVKAPLDIRAAAFLANIPESEFLALNPAFKTPVFIPKGNSRQMLLPIQAAKTFESNYKNSDLNTLLSWDVYTPNSRMALQDIAAQTGSSVSEIQRLNGIRSAYLEAGRTILVNKNRASGIKPASEFAKADFDPVPDTFKEQAPVLNKGTANFPAPTPVVVANTHLNTLPQPENSPAAVAQTSTQTSIRQPGKPAITVTQNSIKPAEKTSIAATPVVVFKPQTQPEKAETVAQAAKQPEKTTIAATPTVVFKPQTQPENESEHNEAPSSQTASNDHSTDDELMQLARASQERIRAAEANKATLASEAVKASLAQSDAEESRARAASEQRATKERARQQQLATAEKAKAPAAKEPTTSTHKVGSGDTLYSIAKRYNMDVAELAALNKIKGNNIKAGQTLKVAHSGNASKPQLVKAVAKGKADTPAHDNRANDKRNKNANPDNKKDSKADKRKAEPAAKNKHDKPKSSPSKNEKPAAKGKGKK